MTFATPTTKAEMYDILQQMFHYYRIQREGYASADLEKLELERMNFSPLSDEQLLSKAKELLCGKKQREIMEYKNSIEQEIVLERSKVNSYTATKQSQIDEVNVLFAESEKTIEEKAIKNGLVGSSIVLDKLTQLETEKNTKIAEINANYTQKVSECSAEIAKLEIKKGQADTYFDAIYQKEESAKLVELKEAQDKTIREVFKYNNSLDEKETKYSNAMLRDNIELKLKYLEIQASQLSRDELVEIGYYEDAINCVTAYYDTLDAAVAYEDIIYEKRLMIFLDEYFENLVFVYKSRSEL
jgi:hypothetical protein